jgi:hypothetical protein
MKNQRSVSLRKALMAAAVAIATGGCMAEAGDDGQGANGAETTATTQAAYTSTCSPPIPVSDQYTSNLTTTTVDTVQDSNWPFPNQWHVYRPTTLSPGLHWPLLVWGSGTFANDGQYTTLLNHLASWGFVVVASTATQYINGEQATAQLMTSGVNYLVGQNANPSSPYYNTLDTSHIGALGHSQGAGAALLVAVHGGSGWSINTVVSFDAPDALQVTTDTLIPQLTSAQSVFYIDGTNDTTFCPPQQIQQYFDETPAGTPAVAGSVLGAGHNGIQDCNPSCDGTGPTPFLGYVTAWLTYRFRGNSYARSAFVGAPPEMSFACTWQNFEAASLP